MPFPVVARAMRVRVPLTPRRVRRSTSAALSALLILTIGLSACDSRGRPAEPELPTADANVVSTTARSERFVLRRDSQQSGRSQQIARSPNFTLIREEARNAPR